jgi:hypothetical protein
MRMSSSIAVHIHMQSRTVELQEVYHRLSDVEHGWNYTCMLLDITHEEVETHTHRTVHLEHHV